MKKYVEIEFKSKILRGYHHKNSYDNLVIMLHGFTGNKTEARLLFRNLSEEMELNGFDSLRMDFFGHGESDGQFKNMTLESLNEQVQTIIEYSINLGYKKLYLLGFSMGGMIALLNLDNMFEKVVLISPATRMPDSTKNLFEQSPLENGNADIGGLELSRNFYESFQEVNVLKYCKTFKKPIMFVIGKNDKAVPYNYVLETKTQFSNSIIHIIDGCDHTYSSIEYRKKLYQVTINFLK